MLLTAGAAARRTEVVPLKVAAALAVPAWLVVQVMLVGVAGLVPAVSVPPRVLVSFHWSALGKLVAVFHTEVPSAV